MSSHYFSFKNNASGYIALNRYVALKLCLLGLTFLLAGNSQHAKEPKHYESGEQAVQLLELYTSQGCSSCPPAEKWFNALEGHNQLWDKIVPVAFHVDYWDYLGWKDPYASKQYSSRQRQHSASKDISVYTPGFILQGQEWRNFFSFFRKPKITIKDNLPIVGNLSFTLDGSAFEANFAPTNHEQKRLILHVAVMAFDLATDIKRGENRGKRIEQDFVVLHYEQYRSADLQWSAKLQTAFLEPPHSLRRGIAVWVSSSDDPAPIQALGGWL